MPLAVSVPEVTLKIVPPVSLNAISVAEMVEEDVLLTV